MSKKYILKQNDDDISIENDKYWITLRQDSDNILINLKHLNNLIDIFSDMKKNKDDAIKEYKMEVK